MRWWDVARTAERPAVGVWAKGVVAGAWALCALAVLASKHDVVRYYMKPHHRARGRVWVVVLGDVCGAARAVCGLSLEVAEC